MYKSILISVLFVTVFYACTSNNKEETEKNESETKIMEEKPVEVKARLLEYQDFNYELISNGVIAASNKADLRFQSQELITKIYVKNGEKVTKGQKLAELDKFKLKNSLAQAEESFERAKLDLQDVLIGQGYSLTDTTRVPSEIMKIAKIRSNYEQSLNNYRMAKYNFDMATLTAPFGGIIANLNVKEHNPQGGEPFCTIIDNERPEVIFNILENELPFVKLNDKVIVSPFSQSNYSIEGRISEINPIIDKNGMVKVKAFVSNRDNKLYEGMNVKIHVQRFLSKQLVIPKSAVVLRTNKKVVFTMKNNKAQWNYVETAQENSDSYVLIPDKIKAGDSIIYEGNMNLMDQVDVILK